MTFIDFIQLDTVPFDVRLVRLPVVLYELKEIQEIIANDNQLAEIDPNGILKISSTLITFNVRNNNLQRLPPELSKCTLLKSLDVAGKHIFNLKKGGL